MTGWTLFLVLVGLCVVTAQFFRLMDAIERPAAPRHRRHSAVRTR